MVQPAKTKYFFTKDMKPEEATKEAERLITMLNGLGIGFWREMKGRVTDSIGVGGDTILEIYRVGTHNYVTQFNCKFYPDI